MNKDKATVRNLLILAGTLVVLLIISAMFVGMFN